MKKTLVKCLNDSTNEAQPLKFKEDPAFLKDNFVLSRYQLKHAELYQAIQTVIDLNNQPFEEQLFSSARFCMENKVLIPVHASNLYCIRHVLKQEKVEGVELDEELARALINNLSKNSRELRIRTLEVLK